MATEDKIRWAKESNSRATEFRHRLNGHNVPEESFQKVEAPQQKKRSLLEMIVRAENIKKPRTERATDEIIAQPAISDDGLEDLFGKQREEPQENVAAAPQIRLDASGNIVSIFSKLTIQHSKRSKSLFSI